MASLLIVLGIALLAFIALAYNSLIHLRNRCENAFATIEVMLKKRYDLIPNLVETVKGYAQHEAAALKEVTELRASAARSGLSADEVARLNNRITGLLRHVIGVAENYPQLKANENFLQLQRALNEIEEQISAARRAFNAAATDLNTAVESFPTNLVASLFGIARRQLLQAAEEERSVPLVEQSPKPPPRA